MPDLTLLIPKISSRTSRPGKGPGKVVSCILLLVKRILGEVGGSDVIYMCTRLEYPAQQVHF